ncbi:hypothetical protein SXCC_04660 [Gluconacetobacter sp. SXCC-1]|nr:hypothetical protein SXCC_04660 [Gluconacetobacter sp. SXCC-1]
MAKLFSKSFRECCLSEKGRYPKTVVFASGCFYGRSHSTA